MLEEIDDFFLELDGRSIGLSLVFYVIGIVFLWRPFIPDTANVISIRVKIILTIAMLPVCYFLTNYILNRD